MPARITPETLRNLNEFFQAKMMPGLKFPGFKMESRTRAAAYIVCKEDAEQVESWAASVLKQMKRLGYIEAAKARRVDDDTKRYLGLRADGWYVQILVSNVYRGAGTDNFTWSTDIEIEFTCDRLL